VLLKLHWFLPYLQKIVFSLIGPMRYHYARGLAEMREVELACSYEFDCLLDFDYRQCSPCRHRAELVTVSGRTTQGILH
jgi:hypothetical protein